MTAWNDQPSTIEDIEALDTEILTCAQIAKVLKANPYAIHVQATQDPAKLGFPVICCGTRVKIPKAPFVRYMRGI